MRYRMIEQQAIGHSLKVQEIARFKFPLDADMWLKGVQGWSAWWFIVKDGRKTLRIGGAPLPLARRGLV